MGNGATTTMGNGVTKTLTTTPDEMGGKHRVIIKDDVIARGKRKFVLSGRLVNSWRAGDHVAVKVLQDAVPDEQFWLDEIQKCTKLSEHVIAYSKTISKPVKIHVEYPMTAYIDKVSKWLEKKMKLKQAEFVLVEDDLGEKYTLFMDARGKMDPKLPASVTDVLSELMHFTYHESCRKELFCGFQGVFSPSSLSLAEPTVHSVDQTYRENDLGLEGILMAFDNHTCTSRCRDWLSPESATFKAESFCTTV